MSAGKPIMDELSHFTETGKLYPPGEWEEPANECDGRCLTAADIGLPEYGGNMVAYPDPDCSLHGDLDQFIEPEREEDMDAEDNRPDDFEQAEVMYRVTLRSDMHPTWRPAGSTNQFEMAMDAAELDFLKRLSAASHEDRSTARVRIKIHRRVREGNIRDDDNFKPA